MIVIRVITRFTPVSKTSYTVNRKFNTGSKSKYIGTIMMKTVEMTKTMLKRSEINKRARIKVGGNAIIQRACCKHIMFNVTTGPRC